MVNMYANAPANAGSGQTPNELIEKTGGNINTLFKNSNGIKGVETNINTLKKVVSDASNTNEISAYYYGFAETEKEKLKETSQNLEKLKIGYQGKTGASVTEAKAIEENIKEIDEANKKVKEEIALCEKIDEITSGSVKIRTKDGILVDKSTFQKMGDSTGSTNNTATTTGSGVTEGGTTENPGITIKETKETTKAVDFFKLYGLKYYEGKDTFGGFLPIQLTSYRFFDNNTTGTGWSTSDNAAADMNTDGNDKIKIILPFKTSSVTDNVSVSIKRKFEGTLSQSLVGMASDVINGIGDRFGGGSKSAEDTIMTLLTMDYQYNSLKKELKIPFILPLTARTFKPTLAWCDNVRTGLGILQGQVYPHSILGVLPSAFNLKIGNLYRGFKGFITSVDLTYSEEQYTNYTGTVIWPLVIEGSFTFLNLNSYMWGNETNTKLDDILKDSRFNLTQKPGILFGDWSNVASAGQNSGIGVSKDIMNIEKSGESELYEGVTQDSGKYPTPKTVEQQQQQVDKANKINDKYDPNKKNENSRKANEADDDDNIDHSTKKQNEGDDDVNTTTTSQKTTDKVNEIGGTGYTRGEDEDKETTSAVKSSTQTTTKAATSVANKSKTVSQSLSETFKKLNTTINTVKNVYNTVKNIKDGNYSSALSSLSSAFTTISPETSKAITNLTSIYNAGKAVVNTAKNGITIDNVSGLFSNLESLTKSIETVSNGTDLIKTVAGANEQTVKLITSGGECIDTFNKNVGNLVDSTVGKAAGVAGTCVQQLFCSIFGGITKKEEDSKTSDNNND